MTPFSAKLLAAVERNDSLLCVGLDPDARAGASAAAARDFCLRIIAATSDLVCCFKPNSAFFEQYGAAGWAALREVIAAVPAHIPVLLDAKRGDIGSTAAAYATAVFDDLAADAVTVSPYLGADSVAPFLARAGKAVFVLCYTSNPSAAELQQYGIAPLYARVARAAQTWGSPQQVGLVVGATQPEQLAEVRRLAPHTWILAPGVGAQGGDLQAALAAGLDADGRGLIVPVSRAVLYADDPRAAALALRDQINAARRALQPSDARQGRLRILARELLEAGCVRLGDFVMASGLPSPIYIDLRRVMSSPTLFRRVVGFYADLAAPLAYDRLAAVPYAALPVTAGLALQLGRPMIYPRKEVKAYGTGQAIEGDYSAGQVALAVEDVITKGGSLLTAIDTLEAGGLTVRDVLVLVDREQGGREALAARGYTLHAALTMAELVGALHAEGLLVGELYARVQAYLAGL
ncbi:MAG: orotidine-5'-phosphate decarboxylase [Anaerolineae bacterium]|jgi:uridine monophosphate synthetase